MGLLRERRAGEALPIIAESLATYAELGHDDGVSYCLDATAAAAVQLGENARRCAVLAGAARALRLRTGVAPPPLERALHDDTLRDLAGDLGEVELRLALSEGEALSVDDAVAVALELAPAPVQGV